MHKSLDKAQIQTDERQTNISMVALEIIRRNKCSLYYSLSLLLMYNSHIWRCALFSFRNMRKEGRTETTLEPRLVCTQGKKGVWIFFLSINYFSSPRIYLMTTPRKLFSHHTHKLYHWARLAAMTVSTATFGPRQARIKDFYQTSYKSCPPLVSLWMAVNTETHNGPKYAQDYCLLISL